jgi:hypothetical protein
LFDEYGSIYALTDLSPVTTPPVEFFTGRTGTRRTHRTAIRRHSLTTSPSSTPIGAPKAPAGLIRHSMPKAAIRQERIMLTLSTSSGSLI